MAKAITAVTGEPHITPEQDSMWHRAVTGLPTCVVDDSKTENFATQIVTNNEIRVRSGIAQLQGRYWCVPINTYDSVNINNGNQGENRIDLIVYRWTKNDELKTEGGDWLVLQGTPTTGTPAVPQHMQGDLDNGDLVADMPMFQVQLAGLSITKITPVFEMALTTEAARISAETIQMFADAGYPIT